jgi:hypothetical protein
MQLTFDKLAESIEPLGNRSVLLFPRDDNFDFCKAIEVVEDLTKNGDITESLHYLFDILDENLSKTDKMTIHKKIAARIKYLELC